MESDRNPSSLEPYSRDQTWHPFSQAPLTEPKVSSTTVGTDDLHEWENIWLENHREHTDPDGVDENGEVLEQDGSLHARWGDLPDYDPILDEEGPTHLLICCGTQRPRGKAVSVAVKPATGPFVTIHDYLSAVHPWLMSSRGDLLAAMGEMMGDQKPWPAETKLMVNYDAPEFLTMQEQADWITEASRPLDPLLQSMGARWAQNE